MGPLNTIHKEVLMARCKMISVKQINTGTPSAMGFIDGVELEKAATRKGSVSSYYVAYMMAAMRAIVAGEKEGRKMVSIKIEDHVAAKWLVKVMAEGYNFGAAGIFARFMAGKTFRMYYNAGDKIQVHINKTKPEPVQG